MERAGLKQDKVESHMERILIRFNFIKKRVRDSRGKSNFRVYDPCSCLIFPVDKTKNFCDSIILI